MSKQPLKGAVIIELAGYLAVPSAGRLLSDWGAEVIKVEPPEGDVTRGPFPGLPADPELDPVFQLANANKRGIVLDLNKQGGREALDKLLEKADVFMSNNRIQALKKWGLDYESVSKRHPYLVWAHISGFGERGPFANSPGYDVVSYWSMTGAMVDFCERDTPPLVLPAGFGDQNCGCTLAGGIAAALYEQKTSGKGTKVSLSLYGQGVWNVAHEVTTTQLGSTEYPQTRKDVTALGNTYRCKDGLWILLCALIYNKDYPRVMRAIGREDLVDDERFNTVARMSNHRSELVEIMDAEMSKKTQEEWLQIFAENDIPHSKLYKFKEISTEPTALENYNIQKVKYRNGAELYESVPPIRFDSIEPNQVRTRGPFLGENTVEVLEEFQFSAEEIEKLLSDRTAVQCQDNVK